MVEEYIPKGRGVWNSLKGVFGHAEFFSAFSLTLF